MKKNIKSFPKSSNIGFELGNETFLRMSIIDYQNIQKNLSEYNLVDASKILWSIRKIKSEKEINNISCLLYTSPSPRD